MYGPYRVIKNAPFRLRRFDSGNTLTISKDGAAFASPAGGAPAETPAASGVWFNTLSAVDMGADHIAYKGAAGSDKSDGFLIPEPCRDSGVAQAGTTSSITLRSGAPSVDLAYTQIEIVDGTGKDQQPRLITSYDTTSKLAAVRPSFSTAPDATSVYIVKSLEKSNMMLMDGSLLAVGRLREFWENFYNVGVVQPGSTTSVIKTNIIGKGDQQLLGAALGCLGTNNNGVMRPIVGYETLTGDITVDPPFAAVPGDGDYVAFFGTTG